MWHERTLSILREMTNPQAIFIRDLCESEGRSYRALAEACVEEWNLGEVPDQALGVSLERKAIDVLGKKRFFTNESRE